MKKCDKGLNNVKGDQYEKDEALEFSLLLKQSKSDEELPCIEFENGTTIQLRGKKPVLLGIT